MSDSAHKWTDAALAELERKLNSAYSSAYKEIKAMLQEQLNKMNLAKGMSKAELYKETLKYDRLAKIEEQLAETVKSVNAESVRIINGDLSGVYQENYNFMSGKMNGVVAPIGKGAVNKIVSGEVSPFSKLAIDSLKDKAVIKSDLTNQLTNGILSGESIESISKRIKGVLENNMAESVRIARTEVTQVEASARQAVGETAKSSGLDVWKRWVSTDDERTRPAHREANGQEVRIDEPFIVDGEKLMYPGDSEGSAGNIINCRCTMVTFTKGTIKT